MFSSVRDGYYNEQRRIRKASQAFGNRAKFAPINVSTETNESHPEEEMKDREGSSSQSPHGSKENFDDEDREAPEAGDEPDTERQSVGVEFSATGAVQDWLVAADALDEGIPEIRASVPSVVAPTTMVRNKSNNYLCPPEVYR
ncbi:unnamed protein product [Gongylonema pulchrum]|uniref:Uncharacterized protein n=1 Tax=Gongylonema pulchrum TaxID=637853 RepID=A0A183EHH4_9BILA|nr:unnamed protein product [Gongylonema pulchrum]